MQPASASEKLAQLRERLAGLGSCLIAFSAGVDSTFLLKVAIDVLGRDAVLAVTARSPSLAGDEAAEAERLAAQLGARLRIVDTQELDDPEYRANTGTRCYVCKRTLFTVMRDLARELDARHILYGAIIDDLSDDRPGHRAARECQVLSPLQDAGLTKAEIRELSRALGLPTWDKPQMACLASRIPRGSVVTEEKLRAVEAAERLVKVAGFRQVRVRHHGTTARIEVEPHDVSRLSALVAGRAFAADFQLLGFHQIECDPHGYRTGTAAAHAAAV